MRRSSALKRNTISFEPWVVSHYLTNNSSRHNSVYFISKRYDTQIICGKEEMNKHYLYILQFPRQIQFCLIYGFIQFSELCILIFINPPATLAVMIFVHNKFMIHKVERVGWSRWGTRRSRRWPLSEPMRVSPELLTLSHTIWQPHRSSKLNQFIFKLLFRVSKIFFGSIYTHP